MTAPTGSRVVGLGGKFLLSTLAWRILESKCGSIIGFVLLNLFENRLVGLDVAFIVSTSGHGVQDVQKWSRRGR